MSEQLIVVPREAPRRLKTPNQCENIGCLNDRAPNRNKCAQHLSCQREYSRKYHEKKRRKQAALLEQFQRTAEQNAQLKEQLKAAQAELQLLKTRVPSSSRPRNPERS